ncbi:MULTISPECIES: dUTP diphosphatase [Pseudovibrio]|uniref:dUTP diphosphatase n=1 Tax=Stappiaceae TaxID=2821832 RepID=UPI0029C44E05|nr:dUTP diphosphatase [Pseudovibrio sp. SPO723]MDX5595099.1 dUTP diphosphatase [Pseudovibrio sp. SPO723]
MTPSLKIKRLAHAEGLQLPAYESREAAGMDLRAAIESTLTLKPGERALIDTGLSMAIPHGFEGQVRPRSGLAAKHGVTVLNTPGTIDSDYRGEVKVILINLGQEEFVVERGMRIAQLIIAPVTQAHILEVAHLDDTERGGGGFGSSGTH